MTTLQEAKGGSINPSRIEISDVSTSINIQVVVFWVVTPDSDVVEYLRFGESNCLHFQVLQHTT